MTTTEERTQEDLPPVGRRLPDDWHPNWCTDACDPVTIHIGEDRTIVLSLEEPWHGVNPSNGRETWHPEELSFNLVMDREDAVEAIFEFSGGHGKCFKMTEDEVVALIRLLSRAHDEAQEGRLAAMRCIAAIESPQP
jgi:hypothetical protein